MERKLASIQKIVNITPIKGYDRVELATVLGWSCIIGKGEFKIGDLVVYFEPDSLLYPHKVWDNILSKRKWRVRTLKMCKVISQGLIMPLDIIKEIDGTARPHMVEGYDLTNILKVKHYEKYKQELALNNDIGKQNNKIIKKLMYFKAFRWVYNMLYGSKIKGLYPTSIISKTDETNIQSFPSFIDENMGSVLYISEKLEGQNGNYLYYRKNGFINRLLNKKQFLVCSHNVKLPHKNNSNWWNVSEKFDIENILKKYQKDTGIHVGVQGEIIGPSIQKNIYKLKELDFYFFNVKNLDTGHYFNLKEKREFANATGLKLVPILDDNFKITSDMGVNEILELANGFSVLNKDTLREGLVIRNINNDRKSIKARSPKYLIKNK